MVNNIFNNEEFSEENEPKKERIQKILYDLMKELLVIEKEEIEPVYDPVYGLIEIFPWESEILTLNEIQKLKWIRQQSLINFSFPGAVHTRFEHSLGTLYIGDKIFGTETYNRILGKTITFDEVENSVDIFIRYFPNITCYQIEEIF